jgi:hypothetical protein
VDILQNIIPPQCHSFLRSPKLGREKKMNRRKEAIAAIKIGGNDGQKIPQGKVFEIPLQFGLCVVHGGGSCWQQCFNLIQSSHIAGCPLDSICVHHSQNINEFLGQAM